jgi:hypothetical protein
MKKKMKLLKVKMLTGTKKSKSSRNNKATIYSGQTSRMRKSELNPASLKIQ